MGEWVEVERQRGSMPCHGLPNQHTLTGLSPHNYTKHITHKHCQLVPLKTITDTEAILLNQLEHQCNALFTQIKKTHLSLEYIIKLH